MGSGSQAVPITMAPWDLEAPAAFEGPDVVTALRGRLAHSWVGKDRNSPCVLPFVSDSRDREAPLSDFCVAVDGHPRPGHPLAHTAVSEGEAPRDVPSFLPLVLPCPLILSNTAGNVYFFCP